MTEDFASLGLAAGLVEAAAAAGFDTPTPVQRQSIPVLRRGGNVVLLAGSGSGVTAAYALGLLDRLQGEAGEPTTEAAEAAEPSEPAPLRPRVLVVAPTEERAADVARTFTRLGGARTVRALTLAWGARGAPEVVVGSIGDVVRSVRESALKLDAVDALVVDRLDMTLSVEGPAALETVASAIPADAQRVVTATEPGKPVDRFVEAHVRRPLSIPPRSIEVERAPQEPPVGELAYVVATAPRKPAALARILRRPRAEPPVVLARCRRSAEALRADLGLRGFTVEGARPDARIRAAPESGPPALIAFDVPVDAAGLAAMDLANGLVIVEPDELPHLRSMAAAANIGLKAVGTHRADRGAAAAFRDAIRRALREEDLDAQILLLEPLLQEHDPVEVAAALSALLRSKRAETVPAASAAERPADRPPAFVRLFVSSGHRDNIRPGDLLGAITGEASATGEQVGRIEIRDTFSVVEVESGIADRVIRALNGTTLRGRSLRVDYDRRGSQGPRPPRLSRTSR